MSYHKRPIRFSGKFGTLDKVLEETDEAIEALEQNNTILFHLELSDIYLALRGVADHHGISMNALEAMADATSRAFESGERKPKSDPNVGKTYSNPATPENIDAKVKPIICPDKDYHQYLGTYECCPCGFSK